MLAVLAAACLIAVLPVVAVSGGLHLWMAPVLLIAAGLVFARHDTGHGLAALTLVALVWVVSTPDPESAWSLVVALLMFAAHTCLALQATGPPTANLAPAVVRRWLLRSASVAVLTAGTYAVARVMGTLTTAEAEVVLPLALTLLAALVLLLRLEIVSEQPPPPWHDSPR